MAFNRCLLLSGVILCTLTLTAGAAQAGFTGPSDPLAPPHVPHESDHAGLDVASYPPDAGTTRRALVVESDLDALRVPNHADLNPRNALTIEMWVKRGTDEADCASLMSKGGGEGYWLGICDGRLRFNVGDRSTADGSTQIPTDRWTHVAVTYDGATRRFYVNGVLDRETTESPAGLVASESDLYIGRDVTPGAPLVGLIDHVRLWHSVRSSAQIDEGREQYLGQAGSSGEVQGLVAEWPLDGETADSVGGHDGHISSGGAYSYDAALPRDISVPLLGDVVELDGKCLAMEYSSAQRVVPDGPDGTRVLIQATDDDVYICFDRMPRPRSQTMGAAVYLDRGSRDPDSVTDPAQPGDYRLSVNTRGTLDAEEGDGSGGFRDIDLSAGTWDAKSVQETDDWSAEFMLPRRLFDRPSDPDDPQQFGLVVSQPEEYTQEDMLWPVGAQKAVPSTWSDVTIDIDAGVPPRWRLTGTALWVDGDGEEHGIAGAVIQLWAVEEDQPREVDSIASDAGGRYELTYEGRSPDSFLVMEIDPRGTTSVSADAGLDGSAIGPNLLHYSVNAARPNLRPSEGRFVDSIGHPAAQALQQHYLILYAEPVTERDLWPIVEAKSSQGFMVTTIDVQSIGRTGEGRDLAEKIHLALREYWESVEPEPVYALLVGRGDRIPVRDVGWMDNDHRDSTKADYHPAWPTDWYYADLDSEWDADADGYHGEFMRCPPGGTYVDPEGEELECPGEGSLLREGPFGALRTSDDDFVPEISIGRIAVNEPGEVRRALAASYRAEEQGSGAKQRALLAGSFYSFEGRSWSAARQQYVPGGNSEADPWMGQPWDGSRPFGRDSADYLELKLRPSLEQAIDEVDRLYESTTPPGLEFLSPSVHQPDAALSPASLAQYWSSGDYGLAHLAGLGWPAGIMGARWLHDWDGNLRIDNPARPGFCSDEQISPLQQVGPPCYELVSQPFIWADTPAPSGIGPIVVASAGSTGAIAWTWDAIDEAGNVIGLEHGPPAIAGSMPASGKAAAWVGALTDVAPGALDQYQIDLASDLISTPLRLGDAVWKAGSELARAGPFDMRSYAMQLFGDPAALYWGNWADSAAPWPQDGRDWRATSYTPYSGPSRPSIAWTTPELSPSSAPSIGRDGDIYVAASSSAGLVRLAPSADVVSQANFGGPGVNRQFAPALTTDAVYLASQQTLHKLDYSLSGAESARLPAGASATGAARVGSDGSIWVPTDRGMARFAGPLAGEIVGTGVPLAGVAFLPSGEAIWSTSAGEIQGWFMDRTGEVSQRIVSSGRLGQITAPAVSAEGTVYVGATSGRLYAIPTESAAWQVDTGASVSQRPAIGPDGVVYVGNDAGIVTAYGPESSGEVWSAELGTAIAAPPVLDGGRLYVVTADLHALDLATGSLLWSVDLDRTDERSVPVVGPDRTIYLLQASGRLTAVREEGWLAAPSEVAITAYAQSANVEWRDNSAEEAGFRVTLCELGERCSTAHTAPADSTSLLVDRHGFAPGTAFYATVQALGRVEETAVSQAPSALDTNHSSDIVRSRVVTAAPLLPREPSDLRADAIASDVVELSWGYPADARELVGFRLSRRAGPQGPFDTVAVVGADARRYVDRDLLPDTTYTYRLAASNETGTSDVVEIGTTTLPVRLARPTDVRAFVANGPMVVVQWRDNASTEDGYLVERRSPGAALYRTVGRLAADTRYFVDTAYITSGQFHYRVKAVSEEADSPYALVAISVGEEIESRLYIPWAWR